MENAVNDDKDFSRAGDVLKEIFDRIQTTEASEYASFFSGWDSIAGPEISTHVVPIDQKGSALILEADHPGWIQRIRMKQSMLLASIRSRYPELGITEIRTVLGRGRPRRTSIPEEATKAAEARKPTKTEREGPAGDDEKAFFDLLETMRRRGRP